MKPHRQRNKAWSTRRSLLVLGWMMMALVLGCGAEHPQELEGAEGAEGISNGMGDNAADEAPENSADTTHDSRWDPPGEWQQLVAPPAAATACTQNGQCASGFCVDGYCCDTKCDYKCMACSAAKKGSGADGVCGSIAYDTDPDNDCPVGACDGKNQCKNYNGVACTSAVSCLSNYCVDGYCCGNICMGACQACSATKKGGGYDGVCGSVKAATDPDNECNPGECNGSGACNASPQPTYANGAACTSAAQCQSGYCADGVCCDSWCLGTCMACTAAKKGGGADGTCGYVANDKDFDDECWAGACNGAGACKNYNGMPCTDKSQCLSNYCVDGYCCGNICNQFCYACSNGKKGYGYDGVCEPIGAGRDQESECNPGECNGSGACNQAQTPLANGTTCVSGGQCASGNCVDGYCCDTTCTETCKACSATKKGGGANGTCGPIASETNPDAECNGGKCDGAGACRYYNGAPCTSTNQCFSNYCVDGVCCGNVCVGSCMACTAAKKGSGNDGACGAIAANTDPDNECIPGECNGSAACNAPQVPQANGASCTLGTQCASGYCVDGLCCDSACTFNCMACSAAKKGQGQDGVCGSIKYDLDPDNECPTGSCDGKNTCRNFNGVACTSWAQCLSNYCVDGYCCNNICMDSCQACSATKKGGGANGSCGSIALNADPDNECTGSQCNGSGACQTAQSKAPNGTPCVSAAQCTSGYCADGVCCDSWCLGACQACTAAKKNSGTDGTCGNIAYDKDPDEECWSGACSGQGTCKQYNGLPCSDLSQCLSNYCVDGYCCNNVCSGKCQSCSAALKGSGANGQCGSTAINTDPDNECTLSCNGAGACQKTPNGVACAAATDCLSGFCVDGVCCDAACSGTCQACTAAKKGGGSDGQCAQIAPNTDPDDECPLGKCNNAGACTVLLANGAACTTNDQCGSDHCVDGVCCNTACTGSCVACALTGTVGTCTPIASGQSDPNGTPACSNICDGNGGCVKNTGQACIAGSECIGRVCDRLVCTVAPPTDTGLVWRTIWQMPAYWAGPYPVMTLEKIVANDSGAVSLGGATSDIDQTPSELEGYFSATGVPNPYKWNGSVGTYHSFWSTLYKTGPYGNYAFYQKVSQFGCVGNFGDGYSTAMAGNRAGQTVHIAQSCDTFGNGTNFGDGVYQIGPVLVRTMAAGPSEVTGVPANIAMPMAYGPSGEVYSVALSGGLTIYKSPAGGGATTVKSVPGSIGSRGFDVDATGNLILAFSFSGSVNFGAGAMTASGTDLGLVKLDPNGNVVWQKRYAASMSVNSFALAGNNGFVVLGSGTVNLGYGTTNGASFGARFDTAGTALWHVYPTGNYRDASASGIFGGSSLEFSGVPTYQNKGLMVEKYNQCSGSSGCKREGASCTTKDECGSGFCVDGVCCDSDCTSACSACTAAKKGAGVDGVCQPISSGNDPENECTLGACNGTGSCKGESGHTCSAGTDCLNGLCVDGFCCNEACSGICRSCSAAKKGGGVDGQCGNTAANTDPDSDCGGGTCSGAGLCAMAGLGISCTNGSECASGFCTDGVCCNAACAGTCEACTAAKKGSGTNGTCGAIAMDTDPDNECTNGVCDGANACKLSLGVTCSTNAQCLSNSCVDGVCCDNACSETCVACTAAKKGSGIDGTCGFMTVNTDPDLECSGSTCSGVASCILTLGSACTLAAQCATGHCRDGVCCDTSCASTCMACSAAKKGGGTDGTCGEIAMGTDPDDECVGAYCDGAAVCAPITCATGADCASGLCSGGECVGIVAEISAGYNRTCARFADGQVKCWGSYLALGLGDTNSRGDAPGEMGANLPAVQLPTGKTPTKITTHGDHSCALLNDASIVCWGDNAYGQLGRGDSVPAVGTMPGTMGDNLLPVNLGTGRFPVDITSGNAHTCALLDDGAVKCWGYNGSGELGLGDKVIRGLSAATMGDNLPTVNLGSGRSAKAIATGERTTCAILDNGSVKCWGYNSIGQLGQGDTIPRGDNPGEMGDNLPSVNLGTGKTAVKITMGSEHVCVQLNDGTIKCWGNGLQGQLGIGVSGIRGSSLADMGDNLPTVDLGTGKTAVQIVAGGDHTCALLNDATLKCWGYNNSGQLGRGDSTYLIGDGPNEMGDNLVAVNVGTGKTIASFSLGSEHTCAVLTDNGVKCWGYNVWGQLGLGNKTDRGRSAGDMGDNLPVVSLY